MGFSLMFLRTSGDAQADADRAGLAAFLERRGLAVAPSSDSIHHLSGADGPLRFDGQWTDLHLDPLDQEGPVGGGIWHATLSDEECAFIHDLCVAGRLLVVNPQGAPLYVVPGGTHEPEELPTGHGDAGVAWVAGPSELQQALTGGFEAFREFRDRVIRGES